MKPVKSPKLRGTWLREISRIQATLRKKIDMALLLTASTEYNPKRKFVALGDNVFYYFDNSSLMRSGTTGLIHIKIVDSCSNPISNHCDLPSTILVDSRGMVYGYRYEQALKIDSQGWNKNILHRECGPASVDTQLLRYNKVIKCIRFYHMGMGHNLTGPAEISFEPVGNYRLSYKWVFYGKEYPLHQVKRMVENPFRVSKQDQLYLKLMLAPST